MAYCVKCGEKVEDSAVICPVCGAVIPKKEAETQSSGYTYGEAETQSSGYTYGEAETQSGGYTYGNAGTQGYGQNVYHTYSDRMEEEGCFPKNEIKSNKAMAVLCYIGILVFIPILAGDKQSEYLKLHKSQGLILFVAERLLNALERYRGWSAGVFAWFTGSLADIGIDIAQFAVLILFIMGIVYACRGTRKELPGIGKIKIFK